MTVSKEVKVHGGSVYVNPSSDHEEVGRYVTMPTPQMEAHEEGIGGLREEVEEILTRSASQSQQ